MRMIEELISDPIVQLLIFVILVIGVFDACKFALSFVWRLLGGKDDEAG